MHKIVSESPRRELKEYVRAFAQREIDCSAADIVQPGVVSLEPVIQFDFCRSPLVEYDTGRKLAASPISIVGPHTSHQYGIRLVGPVDSFGIFFQPLGLSQLFRIPAALLVNQAYTGIDVFGRAIRHLWERMAETEVFGERVKLVEEYLLRHAANILVRSSIVSSASYLFRQLGQIRIEALARHTSLGIRQFERRFSEEIGMPPKLFARITRYQTALDAKISSPDRSWLTVAHEFGYHDQMHMIRDFQSLNGSSPGSTLMQLGDMRPEALAAPQARP